MVYFSIQQRLHFSKIAPWALAPNPLSIKGELLPHWVNSQNVSPYLYVEMLLHNEPNAQSLYGINLVNGYFGYT
jgi:hypothetical protein